jgi:predicted nucleotidyltransferase component of viral defense system
MNLAIKIMLDRYSCASISDYENALKEIIQEISLLGLWRSKFFEKAAFYGGSALRILYGLDRFSEDLDFSLLKKDSKFSCADYCKAIEEELKSFGFLVTVEKKEKVSKSNIESAFIKAGTLKNLLIIDVPTTLEKKMHIGKSLKIKLEIDKEPPRGFSVEAKYLYQPLPFSINTYTIEHLFAGKMHAILCRPWVNRVKGRDWYDLVWYVGQDIPVGLKHLESRMKQSGHLGARERLTEDNLKKRLLKRIDTLDFSKARKDVQSLLKDPASIQVWSKDFFKVICNKIKVKKG